MVFETITLKILLLSCCWSTEVLKYSEVKHISDEWKVFIEGYNKNKIYIIKNRAPDPLLQQSSP